jgi:murein DD-endopeptidase MepM/ murein hydrolase activator NlpD
MKKQKHGAVIKSGMWSRWVLAIVISVISLVLWTACSQPVKSSASGNESDPQEINLPQVAMLPRLPQEAAVSDPDLEYANASSRLALETPSAVPSLDEIVEALKNAERNAYSSLDRVATATIVSGQPLSSSFTEAQVDYSVMLEVLATFKGVYDFRRIRPGMTWRLTQGLDGELKSFAMQTDRLTALYAQRENGAMRAYTVQGDVITIVSEVAGSIESSLSVNLWKQGETDALTQVIADIFAWDIDFYSDIQKGDTYRILVEKKYYGNEFLGYGRVFAATFDGKYMGHRSSYFFESPDGKRVEYFDKDGNSLQKSFLRAPLNTTRVTSKFGFRRHPILKRYKAHNGIDYGAPTGTPIWAITGGKVLKAGRMGGCGIGAVLSHPNGYTSTYCHMSKILVKPGQTIHQKQMIGRVGCTGLCTGPHLHFGMTKGGRFINPQKLKFEPGKPIDAIYKTQFAQLQEEFDTRLAQIELPMFHGPEPPEGMIVTQDGLVVDPTAIAVDINSLNDNAQQELNARN